MPLSWDVKVKAEEIKGSAQGIHQSKSLVSCFATVHSPSFRAEKEEWLENECVHGEITQQECALLTECQV